MMEEKYALAHHYDDENDRVGTCAFIHEEASRRYE
jgi:hypothetical protein